MNPQTRTIAPLRDTYWYPEDDERISCDRAERIERAIERADFLRDQIRDSQWEQEVEAASVKKGME